MSDAQQTKHVTYADAGVDVDEGARAVDAIKGAVKATSRPEVIGGLGGFGSCFSMKGFKDMEDPVLVSGTDGVGTKLAIAQLLDRHDTVGEDLVAMCVDDVVPIGAEPLFFLDYVAIGKLRAEHVAEIVKGIAEGCKKSGCALVGGEMAEHPGVMAKDDYDLAGFCVGVVDRPKMILPEMVQEGDAILGIASSGLHSNGYSLARRVLIDESADLSQYTAPQDRFGGESLVDAMLKPTRIYVKPILGLLEAGLPVHGVAHITGGGITENLNRVLPENLDAEVEWGTWDVPAVVQAAVEAANLSDTEAYRTFNMGVGMCVVCDPDAVDDIAESLTAAGETVFPVGRIVKGTGQVIYK